MSTQQVFLAKMALIMQLSILLAVVSNSPSKPVLTTELGKRMQDRSSLPKFSLIGFEATEKIFQH